MGSSVGDTHKKVALILLILIKVKLSGVSGGTVKIKF
jgi:hypothetical protein